MKSSIWYEKYRPTKIKGLALDRKVKKTFIRYTKQKEIPHLLFHGPAGSGKTTIAHILMKSCAGKSLILNASAEDRSINVIKTKVKQFASTQRTDDRLSIVFFDEANGLTYDAQEALKNVIEKYQSNCRFIFATNYLDKIADAIRSRCTVYNFHSYPITDVIEQVKNILENEEIKYKSKDVAEIVKTYYPDYRTILNTIQTMCVSGEMVFDSHLTISNMAVLSTHLKKGHIFAIRNILADTQDFGFVYKWLFNEFIPKDIGEESYADAALVVAEYMYRDRNVPDREINMTACLIEIMNLMEVSIDFDIPF